MNRTPLTPARSHEAQQGSSRAAGALFERYRSWLRKRMRGRLPPWARGSLDTSDLVQDALHHTFVRLNEFKSNRASALRVYFRRSVENRIRDEMRRATRRRHVIAPEQPLRASEDGAPQLRQLRELRPRERPLVADELGPEGLHQRRRPGLRHAEEPFHVAPREQGPVELLELADGVRDGEEPPGLRGHLQVLSARRTTGRLPAA